MGLEGDYEDMDMEDPASPEAEDDMGGEEPLGMEDDGAEEYGLSGGGGLPLGGLGQSVEENPTDRAFADSAGDIASAMSPLDEMFGDARVGAEEYGMSPEQDPADEFAVPGGNMPGGDMQEKDPGKAMDMKEELLNFLQNEAKARRERAEIYQQRGREYNKNGGQR